MEREICGYDKQNEQFYNETAIVRLGLGFKKKKNKATKHFLKALQRLN